MLQTLNRSFLLFLFILPSMLLKAQIKQWSDLGQLEEKKIECNPRLLKYTVPDTVYIPVKENIPGDKKELWVIRQIPQKGNSNIVTVPMTFINDYRVLNSSQLLVIGELDREKREIAMRPSVTLQTFKDDEVITDTIVFIGGTSSYYALDDAGYLGLQDTLGQFCMISPTGKLLSFNPAINADSVLFSSVHITGNDTLIYVRLTDNQQNKHTDQLYHLSGTLFLTVGALPPVNELKWLPDNRLLVQRNNGYTIFKYPGIESIPAGTNPRLVGMEILLLDDGKDLFWVNPAGDTIQFGKTNSEITVFQPGAGDKDPIVMSRDDGNVQYRLLKNGKLEATTAKPGEMVIPGQVFSLYKNGETSFFVNRDAVSNRMRLRKVTPDKNNQLVVEDIQDFPGPVRELEDITIHPLDPVMGQAYLLLAGDKRSGKKCAYVIKAVKTKFDITRIIELDNAEFIQFPIIGGRILIYIEKGSDVVAFDLVLDRSIPINKQKVKMDDIEFFIRMPQELSGKSNALFYGRGTDKKENTFLIRYEPSLK